MQYRITVSDTQGQVLHSHPQEQWTIIAQAIEDRGGKATLERRDVFTRTKDDSLFLDGLRNPDGTLPQGWMVMPTMIVSPWQVAAEIEVR